MQMLDAGIDADAHAGARAGAPLAVRPRYIRTTVSLREDLHQRLKRHPQGISAALNDILDQKFRRRRGRHPLRGAWKGLGVTRKDWEEVHRASDHEW